MNLGDSFFTPFLLVTVLQLEHPNRSNWPLFLQQCFFAAAFGSIYFFFLPESSCDQQDQGRLCRSREFNTRAYTHAALQLAASLSRSEMTPHFHKGIRNSLDFLSQLIIVWV